MRRLAKKTTILFDPDEFDRLKEVATRHNCSLGELIRTTLRERYLGPDPAVRQRAAEALGELSLPVGSWEEMESETIEGAQE